MQLIKILNLLKDMSKNIIYSIYTDSLNDHVSLNDFKRSQFKKYKNVLIEYQKKYARVCKADYELFSTKSKNYNDVQFEKIFLLEKLSRSYDEMLYIDFDVVPVTTKSFFKTFDLNNICLHCTLKPKWKIKQKKLMLAQDGITSTDTIVNTGVLGINKKAVNALNFSKRIQDIKKQYSDYEPNNEVYMTYILEKYKISYTEIGMQWNFILDNFSRSPTAAAYMLHQSNKDFHETISRLK